MRERERLRVAFLSFRERAGYLAKKIANDCPELTVHDLSHIDALWEVGATVVGSGFTLTPAEGFVLGGAFLLHDLAMSVAAYEGGVDAIRKTERWADSVHHEYQELYGRVPSAAEIQSPEPKIFRRILFDFLRCSHAEQAEKLAFLSFAASDGSRVYLIDDTELRQTFGRIIGKIAHSHWWAIGEIERAFIRPIGAPPWCPQHWTVDPLRLACILRVADAAQIDATRAPMFLRSVTSMGPVAREHWSFQEKLNKPYVRDDALVFTSGPAFHLPDASSWWLCLETLRMVDRELRGVDALLAEKGLQRFAARRVAGVDVPERLATYVQTDGWLPINATIHITDLPHIIRSIGGDELYGKNPTIPVRELIQNASDAIQARRLFERRGGDFGAIDVELCRDAGGAYWLQVSDNGIGMSQRVLTDFLLDFGRSFWTSVEMQEEFPGLRSSGIKATGRYGIGFFSVFMVSDSVKVVTRRSDAAAQDTLVLEFSSGLSGRPILRPADSKERLLDGGTVVRLKLREDPHETMLRDRSREKEISLTKVCGNVAPALDVDLFANEFGNRKQAIWRDDWHTMPGVDLLDRISLNSPESGTEEASTDYEKNLAENLRVLQASDGSPIGRACITKSYYGGGQSSGIVTVGGLGATTTSGIVGVLLGRPLRAARDNALPLVSDDELARWATEQGTLIPALWPNPKTQMECARIVHLCGGKTGTLPIAQHGDDWISAAEFQLRATSLQSVVLLSSFTLDYEFKHLRNARFHDNVFFSEAHSAPSIMQYSGRYHEWWPVHDATKISLRDEWWWLSRSLAGVILIALSNAWGSSVEEILAASPPADKPFDACVGTVEGKDLTTRVTQFSRPK